MASLRFIFFVSYFSFISLLCLFSVSSAIEDDKKEYIVYMGALPSKADYSPMSHHQNILQEVIGLNSVGDSLVRSYGRSFNGFSAKLTEAESEKLAGMDGVVSVFPNQIYQLQTTRSYDFMGLDDKIKRNPEVESNTIIGVIDGGIWPEIPSFSDEGFGPAPKKWKGICKGGLNFTCNKKIIGARFYVEYSAKDAMGHGTHTASIAAGNKVNGASFNGVAEGTARGGIPTGRIAVYKVCEPQGCNGAAILAAFDDAIADGVDVITISIGGGITTFDKDSLSIGAFHAMQNGIVTVAAGGNSGPALKTVANLSPWIITVAASTTDRKLVTKVKTKDGKTFLGNSINDFDLKGQNYPLLYGKPPSSSCSEEQARACSGCFKYAKGKILVCDNNINVLEALDAGAVGVILHIDTDSAGTAPLPVCVLGDSEYKALISYITSTKNPEGTILRSEGIKDNDAPLVASFSSRGPNVLVGDILKPDITAPGVNILAGHSPMAPITADPNDKRRVDYFFQTGTSMACPHVAGAAAYIKTIHPDWSPSIIKSAIMTTAWAMNASQHNNQGAEFAYGSGHVNPVKAIDPGLVYEATKDDYLKMLCGLDFSTDALKVISGENFNCPQDSKPSIRDFNYPSMTAKVSSSSPLEITFSRSLTNVGAAKSNYKAQVISDPKLNIKVEPDSISFNSVGEKKSFKVIVSGKDGLKSISGLVSSSLVWSDGSHVVRSPVVVYS